MSSYRVAILAYPAPYRRANGPEIVDTANELAGGRWSARQSRALLVEGLRTRARLATGGSPRQAWASGIGLAVALSHLASFAMVIVVYSGGSDVVLVSPSPWRDVLITGLPLAALSLTTRWPTALIVAAPVGLLLIGPLADGSSSVPWSFVVAARGSVVVLACVVSAVGDGRRALSPVWALGLLGAVVIVGRVASVPAAVGATGWVQLVMLPLAGLAVVRLDPRPLAVASALWLIQATVGAAAILSPGLIDGRTYALKTALIVVGALSGLLIAGLAGRRWLPATTR